MSTKISAKVESVIKHGGETALVLVLEKPYTTSLEEGDKVYIELTNVFNGDKVEFFHAPAPAPTSGPEPEEEEEEEEEVVDKGPVDSPAQPSPEEPVTEPTSPIVEPEQPVINGSPTPAPEPEQPAV